VRILLSTGLIVAGFLTGSVGGNVLLWPYSTKRRVFGRRWPVRVEWSSLRGRDWLRLFALAAAAFVLMALGLFTLPN
jgi:hypothetical protein